MTMTVYEDYLSSKEWECFLRGRLQEYAQLHPMSIDERQQLLRWALLGNDIHSNPNGWTAVSGEPMDYLDFLRMDPSEYLNQDRTDRQFMQRKKVLA